MRSRKHQCPQDFGCGSRHDGDRYDVEYDCPGCGHRYLTVTNVRADKLAMFGPGSGRHRHFRCGCGMDAWWHGSAVRYTDRTNPSDDVHSIELGQHTEDWQADDAVTVEGADKLSDILDSL